MDSGCSSGKDLPSKEKLCNRVERGFFGINVVTMGEIREYGESKGTKCVAFRRKGND